MSVTHFLARETTPPPGLASLLLYAARAAHWAQSSKNRTRTRLEKFIERLTSKMLTCNAIAWVGDRHQEIVEVDSNTSIGS